MIRTTMTKFRMRARGTLVSGLLCCASLMACGSSRPEARSGDQPITTGVASQRLGGGSSEAAKQADEASPALQLAGDIHKQQVDELVAPLYADQFPWHMATMVGLITEDGIQVYSYGTTEQGGPPPDQYTLFEIGSITKTFTGLLLADAVQRGDVTLDTPVQMLLPQSEVTIPQYLGQPITLRHLATHTSGIPSFPLSFMDKILDPLDPWANISTADAYAFLNTYTLEAAPGSTWAYSNSGMALLGQALAAAFKKDYEHLLKTRITGPLEMPDTAITLNNDEQKRFAQTHNGDLKPTPAWNFDFGAPCGAIRSTTRDLLTYLAAQLGLVQTPLQSAIQATQEELFVYSEDPHYGIGLAWPIDFQRFVWHNGGTYGSHTFVGFDTVTRRGVVVLANAGSIGYGTSTQLGFQLLNMVAGEAYGPIYLPATIPVSSSELAKYAGTFTGELGTAEVKVDTNVLTLDFASCNVPEDLCLMGLRNLYPIDVDVFTDRGDGDVQYFEMGPSGTYDTLFFQTWWGEVYTLTRTGQ